MFKPVFKLLVITCTLIVINYQEIQCNAHILGNAIHAKIVKRSSDFISKRNITKPDGMPNDVYSKLVTESKKLSEKDLEEFWLKVKNWWKDTMSKTGEFFKKIGKLFTDLFKKSTDNEDFPSFTSSADVEVIQTSTITVRDTNKDETNYFPTDVVITSVKNVTSFAVSDGNNTN